MTTSRSTAYEENKHEPREAVDEELYKERILELYKSPLNKHSLAQYTIAHEKANPLCGDRIKIYADIHEGIIHDISFEGYGCAISQAAASLLTEELKKQKTHEASSFPDEKMIALLGIPISHLRQKCALLAVQTFREGIQNAIEHKQDEHAALHKTENTLRNEGEKQ
ncbi:iron-sulfur cluster assembly scaffold protein [Candidatus Woesearchaeota archaeon]|nr:iron-sulfur cluster assembly scaffold protein [Candidatus Woesearchaeota archaeon]